MPLSSASLAQVLYIAPVIVVTDLFFSLLMERELVSSEWWGTPQLAWKLVGALLGISLLVFVLSITEFWLVRLTSSLTLAVLGILKEICTIVFAVLLLGDRLTALDVAGFAVASLGVLLYALSKNESWAAELRGRLPRWLNPWGRLASLEAEEGAAGVEK